MKTRNEAPFYDWHDEARVGEVTLKLTPIEVALVVRALDGSGRVADKELADALRNALRAV